jgi:hypothetical protein
MANVRMARKKLREAVTRGARLLDRRHPRWYKKIDLDTLDLRSNEKCICGQLDGRGRWMEQFDRLRGKNFSSMGLPVRYGFDLFHEDDVPGADWEYAEALWVSEIVRRRRAEVSA